MDVLTERQVYALLLAHREEFLTECTENHGMDHDTARLCLDAFEEEVLSAAHEREDVSPATGTAA